MPEFVKVAKLSECREGEAREAMAGDRPIALCNVGGRVHALEGVCPHRGGPVGQGFMDGTALACPWHGWQYDVTTGQCLNNPSARLQSYPVRIEGDDVMVEI